MVREVVCGECGVLVKTNAHHQFYCRFCSDLVAKKKAKICSQKPERKAKRREWRLKNKEKINARNRSWAKRTGIKQIYSIEDVTPVCSSCNSSKRITPLQEVMEKS